MRAPTEGGPAHACQQDCPCADPEIFPGVGSAVLFEFAGKGGSEAYFGNFIM